MDDLLSVTIVVLIALAVVIAIYAWFFERATREVSLVKTGIGGRKVIMDGGTIAIPWFHEISRINMQTLRLDVHCAGSAALITKDRMRVDVNAQFYVSVDPSADGIARAAQTLGSRTFHADRLCELIEGKLVDSLRSVAARMTMDELHENRGAFVAEVRDGIGESLSRNGLELDSVSLSALDQTPFSSLDENNAFNAVGMRRLAEVIATSKKQRAEVDADAEVSVRRAAMEATKRKLQIDLEEQEAEIAQVQQIEFLKASQLAEVAKRKADSERAAAHARIHMEQEIEVASREREIVLAQKSQEESRAHAEADAARIDAVLAEKEIAKARQVAESNLDKEVALIAARREAESLLLRSDAEKQDILAKAEAQRALNEAENVLTDRAAAMKVDLARLEALPRIIAEMAKPAEKIESIKVHHISGAGRGGSGGDKTAMNQAVDSIMDLAVQLPALRKLGEEIGVAVDDGLTGVADSALRGSARRAAPGEDG